MNYVPKIPNYRSMTNDELLNEADQWLGDEAPEVMLIRELAKRFEPFADLDPDEPYREAIRDELDKRFPELRDDDELSGADTVDRLCEWYYEVAL